ncbi:MAG: hypothetical protein SEPTF4163_000913 [Sporothrix epigloea]
MVNLSPKSDIYRCGASWSDGGYMVLTIDNVQENRRAYFGISGSEIEDGKFSLTHHSSAYIVIPSSDEVNLLPVAVQTRDNVDSDPETQGDDDDSVDIDNVPTVEDGPAATQQYATDPDGPALQDLNGATVSEVAADTPVDPSDIASPPASPQTPVTWSLRNVTRNVSYNPNAVSVDLMIDVSPTQAVPCHIRVGLDENVEPMFASWYAEKCQNSDWYMSWGYNQMTDSAVATIVK